LRFFAQAIKLFSFILTIIMISRPCKTGNMKKSLTKLKSSFIHTLNSVQNQKEDTMSKPTVYAEINIDYTASQNYINELTPMLGPLFPFEDSVHDRFIRRCFHVVGGPTDGAGDGISAALIPTDDALELLSALRTGKLTRESFVAAISHKNPFNNVTKSELKELAEDPYPHLKKLEAFGH
jgi:hypothetical protein